MSTNSKKQVRQNSQVIKQITYHISFILFLYLVACRVQKWTSRFLIELCNTSIMIQIDSIIKIDHSQILRYNFIHYTIDQLLRQAVPYKDNICLFYDVEGNNHIFINGIKNHQNYIPYKNAQQYKNNIWSIFQNKDQKNVIYRPHPLLQKYCRGNAEKGSLKVGECLNSSVSGGDNALLCSGLEKCMNSMPTSYYSPITANYVQQQLSYYKTLSITTIDQIRCKCLANIYFQPQQVINDIFKLIAWNQIYRTTTANSYIYLDYLIQNIHNIIIKKKFYKRFVSVKNKDFQHLLQCQLNYKVKYEVWPYIPDKFRQYQQINHYSPTPQKRTTYLQKRIKTKKQPIQCQQNCVCYMDQQQMLKQGKEFCVYTLKDGWVSQCVNRVNKIQCDHKDPEIMNRCRNSEIKRGLRRRCLKQEEVSGNVINQKQSKQKKQASTNKRSSSKNKKTKKDQIQNNNVIQNGSKNENEQYNNRIIPQPSKTQDHKISQQQNKIHNQNTSKTNEKQCQIQQCIMWGLDLYTRNIIYHSLPQVDLNFSSTSSSTSTTIDPQPLTTSQTNPSNTNTNTFYNDNKDNKNQFIQRTLLKAINFNGFKGYDLKEACLYIINYQQDQQKFQGENLVSNSSKNGSSFLANDKVDENGCTIGSINRVSDNGQLLSTNKYKSNQQVKNVYPTILNNIVIQNKNNTFQQTININLSLTLKQTQSRQKQSQKQKFSQFSHNQLTKPNKIQHQKQAQSSQLHSSTIQKTISKKSSKQKNKQKVKLNDSYQDKQKYVWIFESFRKPYGFYQQRQQYYDFYANQSTITIGNNAHNNSTISTQQILKNTNEEDNNGNNNSLITQKSYIYNDNIHNNHNNSNLQSKCQSKIIQNSKSVHLPPLFTDLDKFYSKILLRNFQYCNRNITNGQNIAYRIHTKGKGARCINKQGIKQGRFIVEYFGQLYEPWRWYQRQDYIKQLLKKKKLKHFIPQFYNIYLQHHKDDPQGYDLLVVDPNRKGNYSSRFSHSCNPNCGTVTTISNGKYYIGMYSFRDIKYGEELTFDYCCMTESSYEHVNSICLCGMMRCRGNYLELANNRTYSMLVDKNTCFLARNSLILQALEPVTKDDLDLCAEYNIKGRMLDDSPQWIKKWTAKLLVFIQAQLKLYKSQLIQKWTKQFPWQHPSPHPSLSAQQQRQQLIELYSQTSKNDLFQLRFQNLFTTVDKMKYFLNTIQNKQAPLIYLEEQEIFRCLVFDKQSIIKEIQEVMIQQEREQQAFLLKKFRQWISAKEEFRDKLFYFRLCCLCISHMLMFVKPSNRFNSHMLADIVYFYAFTHTYFTANQYQSHTSQQIKVSLMQITGKPTDNKTIQKTKKRYSSQFVWGQLVSWYKQTIVSPQASLSQDRRGTLSYPMIKSTINSRYPFEKHCRKAFIKALRQKSANSWPCAPERGCLLSFKNTFKCYGTVFFQNVHNSHKFKDFPSGNLLDIVLDTMDSNFEDKLALFKRVQQKLSGISDFDENYNVLLHVQSKYFSFKNVVPQELIENPDQNRPQKKRKGNGRSSSKQNSQDY